MLVASSAPPTGIRWRALWVNVSRVLGDKVVDLVDGIDVLDY